MTDCAAASFSPRGNMAQCFFNQVRQRINQSHSLFTFIANKEGKINIFYGIHGLHPTGYPESLGLGFYFQLSALGACRE